MKEGWEYKKLGEIVEIKRGLTYSKNDEVESSNKIVLRSNNVNLDNHQFDLSELKYLKPDFEIPAEKYLQKGDLLMCMSNGSKAHLGKVALYEGENNKYAFGGFMAALSHNERVIGKYLFYAMITPMYKEYIKRLSDGANINNLKIKDIEAYTIPVPPLPEQERIVALLDAEFDKIDLLKTNAEHQLQAAKDLFQSALKEILTPKEGWENKKLGALCKILTGKRDANHAKEGGLYRFYTCAAQYLMCDTYSFDGDCLILPGNGANVGDVYIYSGKFEAYQRTYVLNQISEKVLHKYLYYYFLCNWKKKGTAKQYGSATNYIIMSNFTDFTVSYPSLSEQQTIVARLDSLSEHVKQLQSNYEQTITLCNDLKQSLLKSIFA